MRFILVLMAIMVLYTQSSIAQRDSRSDMLSDQERTVLQLFTNLQDQEEQMRSEDYTLAELGEYQYTYLQLIYHAKVLANQESGYGMDVASTNVDLTSLVELGYLGAWPGNPLDDWNPVAVRTDPEVLLPGDIYMELCPDEYSSTIANGPENVSFNIYVISTDEVLGAMGEFLCYNENKEWANKPANAVYGLSYYMMSDRLRDETRRKVEEMGLK